MASFGSGSPSQWAFSGTDPLGSHKLKLDAAKYGLRGGRFRENAVWAGNARHCPWAAENYSGSSGQTAFFVFSAATAGAGVISADLASSTIGRRHING